MLLNNGNYKINDYAIFENKSDMDHWLLNLANNDIDTELKRKYPTFNKNYWNNKIFNINNKYFVVDVNDAIFWIENYIDCKVFCIESEVIKNVKDEYNTDIVKKSRKYNI
jgi:hypothetical protein